MDELKQTQEQMRAVYEPPRLEMIEVPVEQGFASSTSPLPTSNW